MATFRKISELHEIHRKNVPLNQFTSRFYTLKRSHAKLVATAAAKEKNYQRLHANFFSSNIYMRFAHVIGGKLPSSTLTLTHCSQRLSEEITLT